MDGWMDGWMVECDEEKSVKKNQPQKLSTRNQCHGRIFFLFLFSLSLLELSTIQIEKLGVLSRSAAWQCYTLEC